MSSREGRKSSPPQSLELGSTPSAGPTEHQRRLAEAPRAAPRRQFDWLGEITIWLKLEHAARRIAEWFPEGPCHHRLIGITDDNCERCALTESLRKLDAIRAAPST